jgi:hypothetical protein
VGLGRDAGQDHFCGCEYKERLPFVMLSWLIAAGLLDTQALQNIASNVHMLIWPAKAVTRFSSVAKLGVVFVVYPGAGHLTIPLLDMPYQDNPAGHLPPSQCFASENTATGCCIISSRAARLSCQW